jgi:hypothetical protein
MTVVFTLARESSVTSTPQHPIEQPRTEVLPPLPGEPAQAARPASWSSKAFAAVATLVSVLYLANLGAGLFELGPDVLPGIGNLDEVFFTAVLIYSLRQFGIDLLPYVRRGGRKPQ